MKEEKTGTPIRLPSGEVAHVAESDGDKTTVLSPLPSPPGSTFRGQVEGVDAEFQLKVRNCRKQGELFSIDGRTMNATRALKEILRG